MFGDFVEYWSAFHLLTAGQNPYDQQAVLGAQRSMGVFADSPLMMYNPPWLLFLISPILRFDFDRSSVAFLYLNLLLILVMSLMFCSSARMRLRELPVIFMAAFVFPPILLTIYLGQLSIILAFACCGLYWGLVNQKYNVAGVFLSLLTIKPHLFYLLFIVLLWWSVSRRNCKVIFSGAMSTGTLVLFSYCYSPQSFGYWIQFISSEVLLKYYSGTLPGFLSANLLGEADIRLVYLITFAPAVMVSLVVLTYCLVKQPNIGWERMFSPILCLSMFTSPYGWLFDFSALVIVQNVLVARLIDQYSRKNALLLFICLFSSFSCVAMALFGYRDYSNYIFVPVVIFFISIADMKVKPNEINERYRIAS